jgi:S1-C subfamily serine protease
VIPRRGAVRVGIAALVTSIAGTTGCVASPPSTPVAEPSTSILRVHSVDRHNREITVRFRSTGCGNASTGSGFVVGPHEIVTNRHVAGGSLNLEVNTWDGQTYHVNRVDLSDRADLALVHVQETLAVRAELRASQVSNGGDVVISGYPEGNQLRFVDGRLTDTVPGANFDEPNPIEELSGKVQPGNSGGPLLDTDGRVTGVVFAMVVSTGRGLAIDLATLKDFLSTGGHVDRPHC